MSNCEHFWVRRKDGYVEKCGPAICLKCGEYGCYCDFVKDQLKKCSSKTEETLKIKRYKELEVNGNDHELEKQLNKKMNENIDKIVKYNKIVEKHKDKKFCNWHKADQDDFIKAYYNLEHIALSALHESELLDNENKKLKKEIDGRVKKETVKIRAKCRNAIGFVKILISEKEELEKRIKKLNRYKKFDIIDI